MTRLGGSARDDSMLMSVLSVASLVVITVAFAVMGSGVDANGGLDVEFDTEYGSVRVYDDDTGERPTRRLIVSGGAESAMYLDDGMRTDMVFDYTRTVMDIIRDTCDDTSRVVVMGGGGYTIPQATAVGTGAEVTVMEIDPGVTQAARDWFYLGDVEGEGPGLVSTVTGDARLSLCDLDSGSVDVVVNDTFSGIEPARTLSTVEAAREVRRVLRRDGLYVVNVIGSPEGAADSFMGWELRTLRDAFSHVWVFADSSDSVRDGEVAHPEWVDNWVVVATDGGWVPSGELSERGVDVDIDGAETLTDDRCPVEALVAVRGMMS
jgi:predicted membrane-bound spermidine synthase